MSKLPESIARNKERAYAGNLGHERELFCAKYIQEKSQVIKDAEEDQAKETASLNSTITCKKGCPQSTCCMEYVEATIQECETIVYYLYQHPDALAQFIDNFPVWKEKFQSASNIEGELLRIYNEIASPSEKSQRDLEEFERQIFNLHVCYFDYKITCPFLVDKQCLIYNVRPYTCVIAYSDAPLDLCKHRSTMLPPIKRTLLPEGTYYLPDFYYGKLDVPNPLLMASNVYDILVKGYVHVARVTGMKELEEEAKKQNLI